MESDFVLFGSSNPSERGKGQMSKDSCTVGLNPGRQLRPRSAMPSSSGPPRAPRMGKMPASIRNPFYEIGLRIALRSKHEELENLHDELGGAIGGLVQENDELKSEILELKTRLQFKVCEKLQVDIGVYWYLSSNHCTRKRIHKRVIICVCVKPESCSQAASLTRATFLACVVCTCMCMRCCAHV